jgi:hypothetical protein
MGLRMRPRTGFMVALRWLAGSFQWQIGWQIYKKSP